MEWQKGEYTISTDFARLDLALVHHHLSHEAYWSAGIPLEVVARAFQNSLAFGIYRGEEQVGWARLVTDRATFAYRALHRRGRPSRRPLFCSERSFRMAVLL